MLGKLTDTANILKAKITKDDLQQKLIQVTSEQNWQAPTNILHQIANAAYNYQKWQKINDFIWDKLKKKNTWRKIIKTLNLVEFLIKNGPPNAISSFKYDVYQFRTYSDFEMQQGTVDRGQAIRQKSKQIVQLLSNDEHLQEQRQKAKKIRERMANITGGSSYGIYGGSSNNNNGDSKYQSFNNKTYGQKPSSNYGNNQYGGGLGVYGDYNYGKSTLDKYKADQKKNNGPSLNKPLVAADITGSGSEGLTQSKKPFQKIANKLQKPQPKSTTTQVKPNPPTPKKQQKTAPQQNQKKSNYLDDDIFTISQLNIPAQSTPNNLIGNPATPVNNTNNNINLGLDLSNTFQPVTTPQVVIPQVQNQGLLYNQPLYQPANGQTFTQQSYSSSIMPQYGQPYPQPQPYGPSINYGYNQPNAAYNQPAYNQQPTNPYQNFQANPNISLNINPLNLNPINTSNLGALNKQITLDTQNDVDTNLIGTNQSKSNVKWLSNQEKGLIDLSDFSSELKNTSNFNNPTNKKKQDKGNNILIDQWNW